MTEYRNLTVIGHPIVLDRLSRLRDRRTSNSEFRRLVGEITTFLTYEVTRELETTLTPIETPLVQFNAPVLKPTNNVVIVSILRAGNGILENMLDLIPEARVGHIGLSRDHETLEAREYFFKLPSGVEESDMIVVDPMLATANSAIAAISRLKEVKPRSIKLVCILSSPEGVKALSSAHPDVKIFTAAVDSHLNEKGYIVPGLGDAGDRYYGTD